MSESKRLESLSYTAQYSRGIMVRATKHCAKIFKENMVPGSVLEVGPAEGIMTDFLYPHFNDYSIIDGASTFVEKISHRYPLINAKVGLIEDLDEDLSYDNIILGHVLEHVISPVDVLKSVSMHLKKGGRVLCAVPNAKSLHRSAAVIMNLLNTNYELNETDKKNGHRRVYDFELLKNDFQFASLVILKGGGYWLKALSNNQIENFYTPEMIDAFMIMGESFPEIAGEIYIVATKS